MDEWIPRNSLTVNGQVSLQIIMDRACAQWFCPIRTRQGSRGLGRHAGEDRVRCGNEFIPHRMVGRSAASMGDVRCLGSEKGRSHAEVRVRMPEKL